MEFNKYLMDTIEKIGWSKNYVSQRFNINRGTLHKYLNGALLFPKDVFYELIEAMPISKIDYLHLLDLYCAEFYGKEKYRSIKDLKQTLTQLDDTCVPHSVSLFKETFDSETFEKTGKLVLQTTGELLSCVQYMCDTAKKGTLFTNYPYTFQALDDTLFQIHYEKKTLDIRHFISFSKDLGSFELTQNLFSSIRWLQNRVNPICCYVNSQENKLVAFPYFIAFNTCVLLFNNDFSTGFLARDVELFSYFERTYESLIHTSSAFSLAVFPSDMFALKNSITENSNAVTEASLTQYACVAAIADEEFIYSVMRKDIPGIERLAQLGVDHYANGFGKEIKQYFIQESGFKAFAEYGTVYEVPSVYIQAADTEQRIRYFKKMLDLNKRGGLKIMKDTLFTFPKAIGVTVFDRYIKLYGYFENIPKEYQSYSNWIISINDNQIFEGLHRFVEYLNDMQIFYSQKGAEDFLKSMIISLDGTV